MTPEKEVQNKILNYLKKLKDSGYPVFYDRRQAGGFSYKKGIPDIYASINGLHVEIEVKKPGGQLSTMQEKFRDYFISINTKWICVDNIEEFKNFVELILKDSN